MATENINRSNVGVCRVQFQPVHISRQHQTTTKKKGTEQAGKEHAPGKSQSLSKNSQARRKALPMRRQLRIQLLAVFTAIIVCFAGIFCIGTLTRQAAAKERIPAVKQESLSGDQAGNDDWKLLLVNPWNYVPDGYGEQINLKQLKNGQAVDERCYQDLQDMIDACKSEGLNPCICSSYRTIEKQERLYQNKVKRLVAEGYSQSEAETKAGSVVAIPGTSEHHLGLALDIVDENYQELNTNQENTAVQQWLMSNSWRYGFILRYPNEKSSITGIIYEPWHYRYVGKEAARSIYKQGICLEEYLEKQRH